MDTPLYDFRPGRWKRWLVFALGVVIIGIGIADLMAIWKPGGLPRDQARPMAMVLTVGTLLLFLVSLFGNTRVLITSSEVVLMRGWVLLFFGRRERVSCRWDEVTEIVVTSEVVVTIYRGRETKTTHTVCRLVRKDGSRFELREADRADIEPVLDALRREAAAHGIPWRQ